MRWHKKKSAAQPEGTYDNVPKVGMVTVDIKVGSFHAEASTSIHGFPHIEGDTVEEMRYDIDYTKAHEIIVEALEDLVGMIRDDEDFKRRIEHVGD